MARRCARPRRISTSSIERSDQTPPVHVIQAQPGFIAPLRWRFRHGIIGRNSTGIQLPLPRWIPAFELRFWRDRDETRFAVLKGDRRLIEWRSLAVGFPAD
jgi:hypothetical protein